MVLDVLCLSSLIPKFDFYRSDISRPSRAKQTTPQGVVSSIVLNIVTAFSPFNSIDGGTIVHEITTVVPSNE